MDRISSLLPHVKLERLPISTPNHPSSESNLIKQEQPDMTNTNTVDILPPAFINSINEIRRLSTALSTFLRQYDELQDHLNLIKSSINSNFPNHLLYTANPNESTLTSLVETSRTHTITAVQEATVSEQNPNVTATDCERSHEHVRKPVKPNFSKKPEEINTPEKTEEVDTGKKTGEIDISKKCAVSDLESICKRMSGRHLKKYVATHISDMNKIRQELPKALKLAKDPAKLVLLSIGRFFAGDSRSFSNGSALSMTRLASVLILECFVMISSDNIKITKQDEEHAAQAADDWKKRMIKEGGFNTANEVDARGLLLLISGFGIPDHVFGNNDIVDLIKASNVKGISTALVGSTIFIQKVTELIDWMVKLNMEIEAADLAYTMGLEDKFHPQTILTTFFHNKIKDKQHTSLDQIKHHISELKSFSKCLESHSIDPSKLFPDFKINEKIQQLEKETLEHDLVATQKRKAEPEVQVPKRSRGNMPHQQSPYPAIENGGMLAGVHGGPVVDHMANGGPYGRYNDPALSNRSLGQPYFSQPYSPQPSSSGLIGLYGGPSGRAFIESFPELPTFARRGPFSDLYSFADKV
ncbi:unnamed protein product [Lactuca virosa]|uniref:FRIGIDA-like protein n=1 Tax=Lactuca virosa TaxID=75947 RepID=A0AAU9MNP1_9ASTR|nr:unnamed protein product [Lactuca virosa]